MEHGVNKIGEYQGVSVYSDSASSGSIYRARGPVGEVEQGGPVWWNQETGEMKTEDGQDYVPKTYEYETKFYIVPTDNIEEATQLINKYIYETDGKN
jgi:hypothetical protein